MLEQFLKMFLFHIAGKSWVGNRGRDVIRGSGSSNHGALVLEEKHQNEAIIASRVNSLSDRSQTEDSLPIC